MEFNLTDEQRERARKAESPEEMLAIAQEEGIELTDDQLEAVAGGWDGSGCSDNQNFQRRQGS